MTQKRYNLRNWHDNGSIVNQFAQDYGKVQNMALFVQDEVQLSEPLTMYLGLRLDHYKKVTAISGILTAISIIPLLLKLIMN